MLRILKGGVMIRKRVVISIILTLLAIWGSHNYWLQIKPIDVTFNLQGKNIKQAEVQLYKYSDENSKKFYSQSTKGKIKKQVKLSFKKPYAPKRLKLLITLNSLEGGGVCNLKLKDGKVKLNDLKNFSATGATLKVKDNKLLFSPTDKNVVISYNKKLNLHAGTKFDLLVLLIIAIITYLFAYKITSYLADFKINKDKSRIDIVFLAIFFLILFIPMMRLSSEKTSTAENRKLAVYKPLFKKTGTLNWNYGKDFDNWFNDRFNFREKIIQAQHEAEYNIRTDFVNINNHFIFKSNGYIINNYKSTFKPLTKDELELYSYNLYRFNKFCEDNGSKLYIVIPPASNSYLKKEILIYNTYPQDRTLKLVDYAKKKYNLDIIFPEKVLREAEKNGLVYFKTDHHWTDYGAYAIYKFLITKMQKDFPLLTITPLSEFKEYKKTTIRADWPHKFDIGGEYKTVNIKEARFENTEYIYYDYKHPKTIKITGDKEHWTHTNKQGHYKLLILGDSNMENMTYFLNTSFYKIEKYRTNMDMNTLKHPKRKSELEMRPYENIIKKYKPDAVILIKHSGTMDAFKKMYPREE